ncbi:hypothetical protein DPMN_080439 [Dreissena polymorpha]|uniref:Uncharacterized protein n=2 Tax=Dreissena polymorpha TaxID=45954 RepID=A0A9D3YV43_DREPO|nr:hypothetical protein DPMN_080439 [Dreissena polymorpha]
MLNENMDKTSVALLFLLTCTGPVSCSESCLTMYWPYYDTCTHYCCKWSNSNYGYCCYISNADSIISDDFPYWIIAPIVIGAILFIGSIVGFIVCCCVTSSNGRTYYQSCCNSRVGGTAIEMTASVNQQQSMMNNLTYTQQQYPQAYPMYPQPYHTGQQTCVPGPQFGVLQTPMQAGSSPSVPPPSSYEQGNQDAINPKTY